MAGASERHNRIALNIAFHLRAATRGTPCRAFMADMKLRVADLDAFYYPDAMLVCAAEDEHPIYKTAPCFVAEVMSPSTMAIDQREKFLAYRGLPSLRYYLLVDSERAYARLYSREDDGAWYERELERSEVIRLRCDSCEIPLGLDDLYEDTGLLLV